MANEKPVKIVTKKHLARLERERRQTRIITAIAVLIITAVIGLITYGILNETVLLARRPILTVNGESVKVREFKIRVKAQRQQMVDTYMQYYQLYQMFGMDPSQDTNLTQIQTQLDTPSQVGSDVLNTMLDNLLVRQYAKANGIVVTAEDIDKAIRETFKYYPDGTPTPAFTSTPLVYSTLSPAQLALMTPTFTPNPGPTSTKLPTQTIDPAATATTVPSITPTATPYTAEGFQTSYQEALDYYGKLGVNDADYRRFYFEDSLYRNLVMDAVLTDVSHEAEQVWARHILVADEATAQGIYAQLIAGGDFVALAAANSTDTSNASSGGDLGWFGRGKMVAEFETAAFALKIGEISQPVQTTLGWHIIQVLGHENRPMSDTEYQTARDAAFSTWLQAQRDASEIVVADGWVDYTPDTPTLAGAFLDLYATQTAYAPTANAAQTTQP